MESSLIKRQYSGILGWLLSAGLMVGIGNLVIHFYYAKETVWICSSLILINLIFHAYIEKNKNLFNYLLFCFILLRVLIILTPSFLYQWNITINRDLTWWSDIFLGIFISILGIKYCFRLIKHK